MTPTTRYARNGEVSIAYQAHGDGPLDLVLIPGFVSNVEHWWDMPNVPRMFDWIARFARLILFDKRGTGQSDPVAEVPTMAERVGDLSAVLDAAGSERAVLWGISEGGPCAIVYAADHPERVERLVVYGSTARFSRAPDWPAGIPSHLWGPVLDEARARWGEGALLSLFMPSGEHDPVLARSWSDFQRHGASPRMGRAVLEAVVDVDVRERLADVHVPTLVLHRADDRSVVAAAGRATAAGIPGARYVELAGADHVPWAGDWAAIISEIEEFVTGRRSTGPPGRAIVTVLFTDIVDSTARAAELGDTAWRELLAAHDALVRRQVERFGGRVVKTTGDGVLATFDRPATAIEAARAIEAGAAPHGLGLRAGVHTGEAEIVGDDVAGMAVHIAARVASWAGAGEVLTSSTVRELVVGSPVAFEDRGEHELKGVPGRWRLHAVAG